MLSLRSLLRHPLQFAIMVFGIALGVAVMVSIDLANASAGRAFDLSTSAVAGRATHMIVAGDQGVDESLYVHLQTDPQWRETLESAPLVMAYAISPQLGKVPFTLLGIDPLAEAPFRDYLSTGQGTDLQTVVSLLTVPGSILLSAPTAERYGLQPCLPAELEDACRLTLFINGETRHVYLTGLLEPSDDFSRRALDTLILTDISTAQSLTGMEGKLTQIDLILPENFDEGALSAALPAGTLLVTSERRNSQVTEMTAAFQIDLTALSLLALIVGIFLIYNTMTFSVVQRRALFGTLRSIGYTRTQIFGMVLGEAAIIGLLGSGLGLGLGVLLGQGAVRMVTRTVNDLFFVVSVRGIQIPASSLLKGGLAGFLACVLAAIPPAWEAASVTPRQALSRASLESKAKSAVKVAAGLGVFITLLGALILAISTRNLVVSFAGTFAVIIGLAMLTPLVTVSLMRLLTEPLGKGFGLLGRLAPRNVIRSQSRTAVAVAALMIAVSVTIGVQVMIASFRTTVTIWLQETMRGDVYISTQDLSAPLTDMPLDPQAIAIAREQPECSPASRCASSLSNRKDGPLDLVAVTPNPPMNPAPVYRRARWSGTRLANGKGWRHPALGAACKPAGDFCSRWVAGSTDPRWLAVVSHRGHLCGLRLHARNGSHEPGRLSPVLAR